MNLYISDLHFGHTNVIAFDKRPYKDRDEMDSDMIRRWNEKVADDDQVYILGDVCYHTKNTADWYLKQLKGHKHLIVGNHDGLLLENEKALKCLESVDKMRHVTDGENEICLCHYPLAEWNKESYGSYHIYGHIHAKKDEVYMFMKTKPHALNAAACINNYAPASFDELIINNAAFQAKD